jgi:hypothetical protein
LLGGGCPAALRPATLRAAGPADLVLLTPTAAELRSAGWLAGAAAEAARYVAPDGVVYGLAPPRARPALARALGRQGLLVEGALAHVPSWERSDYLVPLRLGPLRYAAAQLIALRPWRRRLLEAALPLPGASGLLGLALPAAGLVARRPGARPLFSWLFELGPRSAAPGPVLVSMSWRGPAGAVVLHRFPGDGAAPDAVLKTTLDGRASAGLLAEAEALARLGSAGALAGARVPRLLGFAGVGGAPALLQSALGGQPLRKLLTAEPWRLPELLERLANWLARWNRSTAALTTIDKGLLRRELLEPAARLAPLLPGGEEYRRWLAARCRAVTGLATPLPATHNDLTMSNVLIDRRGALGVIDWETARPQGLPLIDLFFATADAVRVATGDESWRAALLACAAPGGRYAGRAAILLGRLVDALALPPALVGLCFHACWIQQALAGCDQQPAHAGEQLLQAARWVAVEGRELPLIAQSHEQF